MNNYSLSEAASIIRRFLDGSATAGEWDEFISVPAFNPEVEKLRLRCRDYTMEGNLFHGGEKIDGLLREIE